ncbi:MAG: DUF371 domain-containing protein [Candidatus Methanomethyliaceae archaeon]|nr:DUF371 domain-containing protein [Candidatus Methanomethyliaceae archaeon]
MFTLKVTFYAWGDPLITALHRTTIEVTKEKMKSIRGDCVVATRSELALRDLPEEFKRVAKLDGSRIGMIIEVNGMYEEVWGRGHHSLTFESEEDMVIRKSGYICGRTLMINSDKAAADLNRNIVSLLKRCETRIKLTLIVE